MIHNNITKKQKEILLLLYRFRFLNRLHIQTYLKHKDPTTINIWLKDLVEKEYIHRIFKRSWTENNQPAKYYIGKNGIRFLKTQEQCHKEYLRKLYREKDRSQTFIGHCLFIADAYLQLQEATKESSSFYQFYTQSDLTPGSIMQEILPDFFIAKNATKKPKYFAYELIKEGTPRFAIRARIQRYIDFFQEEEGIQNVDITFICDKKLFKFVNSFVTRLLDEDESIDIQLSVKSKEDTIF